MLVNRDLDFIAVQNIVQTEIFISVLVCIFSFLCLYNIFLWFKTSLYDMLCRNAVQYINFYRVFGVYCA